jgi:hypothetical protein
MFEDLEDLPIPEDATAGSASQLICFEPHGDSCGRHAVPQGEILDQDQDLDVLAPGCCPGRLSDVHDVGYTLERWAEPSVMARIARGEVMWARGNVMNDVLDLDSALEFGHGTSGMGTSREWH